MTDFLNRPLKPDQKAFIADNILFLQNWRRPEADNLPWLIFNGDNTLWDVEVLYDEARDLFSRFLALKFFDWSGVEEAKTQEAKAGLAGLQASFDSYLPQIDFIGFSGTVNDLVSTIKSSGDDPYRRYMRIVKTIDAQQRETDIGLQKLMGYDPERFPTSFARTVEHLIDGNIPAGKQDDPDYADIVALARTAAPERDKLRETAYGIARTVFNRPAPVYLKSAAVVEAAGHDYRLMMLSAGEVMVQMHRLKDLGFADLFEYVALTEKKVQSTFNTVCNFISVKPEQATMVGDSLSSDIVTANALGLKTVWVMHHNWDAENRGRVVPDATIRIKEIENLPESLRFRNSLKDAFMAGDRPSWYTPRTGFSARPGRIIGPKSP